MKIILIILTSCLISGNLIAQFEYNAIDSYGQFTTVFEHGGKIYGIPKDASTIVEVDKSSKEINTYNIYSGYPIRWVRQVFKVDSFLVIKNYDDIVKDYNGILTINLNSKAVNFLACDDVIPYVQANNYNNFHTSCATNDTATIYMSVSDSDIDKYLVLTYNPIAGIDSLDLSPLPRFTEEHFIRLKKTANHFYALTTTNRFLIWEQSSPEAYIEVDFEGKDFNSFLNDYHPDNCYVEVTEEIGGEEQHTIYILDELGDFTNLTDLMGAPNLPIVKMEVAANKVAVLYESKQLFTYDLITGESTVNDASTFGLTSQLTSFIHDKENGGYWLVTNHFNKKEYDQTLHYINPAGGLTDFETNPNYFLTKRYNHFVYKSSKNHIVLMRTKSFAVFDGEHYKEYYWKNPWIETVDLTYYNSNSSSIKREDNKGNLYVQLDFGFDPFSTIIDTTFYIKITPDYTSELLSIANFDKMVNQHYVEFSGYTCEIDAGVVKIYNDELELLPITIDDSLTRVHGFKNKVLLSSLTSVYLLNLDDQSVKILRDNNAFSNTRDLSNDRLGNFYVRDHSFHKVPFNQDTLINLQLPDSILFMNSTLMHDWNGNLFANRTGYAIVDPPFNTHYGYLIYHNGFNWDFSNSIQLNLTNASNNYRLHTSSMATEQFLYTRKSIVEIDCPCREVAEIKEVYILADASEYIDLSVGDDFIAQQWDDGTSGSERSINQPGEYWVKVLNAKGCTSVKEFKVVLKPTSMANNGTIIYNSGTNTFPLSLADDLQGDLYIYDLKGAVVRQFDAYQNDWVPEAELSNSIFIYAVYNNDNLLRAGRILFL